MKNVHHEPLRKYKLKSWDAQYTPIRMAKNKKGKRVKTSNGEKAQKLAGENVMIQPVS